MSSDLLPFSYYQSEDVIHLAQDLLGKIICTRIDGLQVCAKIVETEAYKAPEDKASHAYGNKNTPRTSTMFLPGGVSYIYLCYGIHHLFNVVTAKEGTAHAILIRAVEPIDGIDVMLSRRGMNKPSPQLLNGPGKWTEALGLDRAHNSVALYDHNSAVKIFNNTGIDTDNIICSERVGVAYAKECALWPWRFRIKDNLWTSKPDKVSYPIGI